MTKDEAMTVLQGTAESEMGVAGFMVISLTSDDIEQCCDDDVCERYRMLTPEQRKRFLARLTDEMAELFEQNPDYTACKLMYDTRDCIEDDNNVDNGLLWLMDKVEKENGNEQG